MLSLIGSIQPDPFSPEHVPQQQTKSDRAQSPQSSPPPYPVLDPAESEASNDDEDDKDAPARLGSVNDHGAARKAKKGKETPEKERKREKKEEKKRKRKGDKAMAKSEAKSEPKPKRKKVS
jgi:DNA-directed RNA polymerase I subunit RPA43